MPADEYGVREGRFQAKALGSFPKIHDRFTLRTPRPVRLSGALLNRVPGRSPIMSLVSISHHPRVRRQVRSWLVFLAGLVAVALAIGL
ncbi:MAG: hypothetical protein RL885_11050 [Planctomycetota bacterium]